MRQMPHLVLATLLLLAVGCGDKQPSGSGAAPTEEGSVVRGGLLYDKFWNASSAPRPKETHPLWSKRPDTESNTRTGSTTWRCKECHGWDYEGVNGAYATGSHKTGFPGILGTKLSAAELLTSIAETHGYRKAGLKEAQLASLVQFVQEGVIDTKPWINEDGTFKGDAARGKTFYESGLGGNKACRACHGVDGLKPPKGAPPGYEDFVGTVAVKNPVEFLHKVRFGHPGSKMPAAADGTASLQDVIDLAAFAQTLPTKK